MRHSNWQNKCGFLAVALAALLVWGCDQQPTSFEDDSAETIQRPSENRLSIDRALESMAKNMAHSMQDKGFRMAVKEETGKMFDGDHNVLYSRIKGDELGQDLTFAQRLERSRAEMKAQAGASNLVAAGTLEKVASAIPKFNIGVPILHDEWDAEAYVPLVTFAPASVNDEDVERLKAFDTEGNVHWLDADEAPTNPIVVLSISERTDAAGNLTYVERAGAGPRSNAMPQECDDNQIVLECGGGGGSGGGGGGGSHPPREDGDQQYLDRARVLDDHEKYWLEDPEVRVMIQSETHVDLYYGDIGWDGGGKFSDDTDWKDYHRLLFQWHVGTYGDYAIFNWFEYDEGESIPSFDIPYKGETYSFNGWTNDNDDMGYAAVHFDDAHSNTYDIGDIRWELDW